MSLNTFQPSGDPSSGTASAGRMVPPTSTRFSARLKCVQGHVSPVHVHFFLVSSVQGTCRQADHRRAVHITPHDCPLLYERVQPFMSFHTCPLHNAGGALPDENPHVPPAGDGDRVIVWSGCTPAPLHRGSYTSFVLIPGDGLKTPIL